MEVVPIPGGTDRTVAALDKGEIDAGKNATPYLIQAVLKGSDAVAIVAQTITPVYSLIVRPEIKSFADLKRKLIGLSTAGDTITLSMKVKPMVPRSPRRTHWTSNSRNAPTCRLPAWRESQRS